MSNCAIVMLVLAREASVVLTEQATTSHPDSPTPDKVEATIYTPQVPPSLQQLFHFFPLS